MKISISYYLLNKLHLYKLKFMKVCKQNRENPMIMYTIWFILYAIRQLGLILLIILCFII